MSEPQLTLQFDRDKRWNRGRQRFVLPPQVFDPNGFHAAPISARAAREFTLEHHYASFPAARFCYGLFRKAELVGAAVLSVPMSQSVIPKYLRVPPQHGVELGRFCLKDSVLFNGESWFLKRVLRMLRDDDPKLVGVLSFAVHSSDAIA